ncbi:hypothetical protein [Coleofasciculus sp. H7-2]|uniref:hypothetical protein n=1 Tax=Coleofasciculus sp. H7-2 TaxID=3351545 RepID=UPI00366AD318
MNYCFPAPLYGWSREFFFAQNSIGSMTATLEVNQFVFLLYPLPSKVSSSSNKLYDAYLAMCPDAY